MTSARAQVLPRTTSSVSSTTRCTGPRNVPLIRLTSMSAAQVPMWYAGCDTTESGGSVTRAHGAGDRVVLTVTQFDQGTLNQLTSDPTAPGTLANALISVAAGDTALTLTSIDQTTAVKRAWAALASV